MMQVVEAGEDLKDQWDAFVAGTPTGSFLQSWAWGEFQRTAGFPVVRLAVVESPVSSLQSPVAPAATCLLVHRSLPFGRHYVYAPWGPVLRTGGRGQGTRDRAVFDVLTANLRERLRVGAVFARLEPKALRTDAAAEVLGAQGYLLPDRSIQPRDTLVVDLVKSEDDLLLGMHPKTRYNIRVARRHSVVVEERTDAEGLQTFLALAHEVESRGEFRYHPEKYYAVMLRVLQSVGMLTIHVARHQRQPLAANLLIRFGDTVTYAHGASSGAKKHVMAPYLLHWESMLRAKTAGAARYDFFGIAPAGSGPRHSWFGITRFKKGFGGAEEHFVGAADLVGDRTVYRAYEAGRSLKALLRSPH